MTDPFLWIKENEIRIPGVTGEHVFLHVSDTHLSVADEFSTDEERAEAAKREENWMRGKENFARGFGEPFGEAQKIGTPEGFDRLLAYAEKEKPEALLLTGDNLEAMHPAGERFLARKLNETGIPFLCVPGNHEAEECAGAWEPGVRVIESDGFRIAAVDDRKQTVRGEDLDALEALAAEGIPMILIYHIPVAAAENREAMRRFGPYFSVDRESEDGNARRFVRFLEECEPVRLTLCGHIHGYSDTEIVPGKRQITASQGMIGFVGRLTVKGTV